jgi:serine/threonine protein kinase/tetratricopeptide (TPR) repeat protein
MTPKRWARVQEVFGAALSLSPDARAAFLQREFADDVELRQEVESLLTSHEAATSQFLESPGMQTALVGQALSPGTVLGHYEILGSIGAGGMGEVYRARDRALDREVAIKVLPEYLMTNAAALTRFEREAKAVAALSHPNILAIHDFGRQGETAYAVMEFLEGETLAAKLTSGPVAAKQAVAYARQIASGLAAAHEKGIIHRDLTPNNVFVARDGYVKILDFGLAKRQATISPGVTTSATTDFDLTGPGTVAGTVGYMSPEQVRGLPLDHRTDIFSFGVILYEMLSGQRAFKRATKADTISAIIHEEPPDLIGLCRDVSPALDHVVKHCLEKDRENRFQSARDVSFALLETSPHATTSSPHTAQASRDRRNFAATAVLIVFIASAGLLLWKGAKRPPTVPSDGVKRIAVLPFENLGSPEDDYFADGMSDEVRSKLTSLPGIEVIARASSTTYKKTTKKPQTIAEELGVGYLLTATVRWEKSRGASRVQVTPELVDVRSAGAPSSKWEQAFDSALTDVFEVQGDIASRVAQALGVALAEARKKQFGERLTQNPDAYDAYMKAQELFQTETVSPQMHQRVLQLYERAVALDPDFALAWAALGTEASYAYYDTTTPDLAERALDASEKAVALAASRPEPYYALGTYYRLVRRDPQRALEECTKGLRLDPGNSDLIRGIAQAERMLGRWDEALEKFRQAERLDPRNVFSLSNLAWHLLLMHRLSEAIQLLNRALSIAPQNLTLTMMKAQALIAQGDLPGARALLREAQAHSGPTAVVALTAHFWLEWVLDDKQVSLVRGLTPAAFGDREDDWAICQARICGRIGDAACARRYADRARQAAEVYLRSASVDNSQPLSIHALALAYLGRPREAIREAQQAIVLLPPAQHANEAASLRHQLARIYILAGDPNSAIDVLETLLATPCLLSPGWLKIDPTFDSLRSNARFQRLVSGK